MLWHFLLHYFFVFFQFGDLDPASADFFLQEERIKQLHAGYEAQYRVYKKNTKASIEKKCGEKSFMVF